MTQGSISVLNYSDYRSFLKDQLKAYKARNARFSFQAWARRMGLKSQSTLVMIVNGQRNPGPELVESFIKDLRLQGKEAAFFRDLVFLEKCPENSRTRTTVMERLATLHPRKEFRSLDAKTFQAISNWHYYAIRELIDLPDFVEDPVWIQKRLRVSLSQKEILTAIETLLKLELINRDETGRLVYSQYVQSTFDVPDEGLRRFHHQILQLAQGSLEDVAAKEREVAGITFTLKKTDLPKAKDILRQALEQIGRLGLERGDEVYHVEMALFPLTEKSGDKK